MSKKCFMIGIPLLFAVLFLGASTDVYANVFASDIRVVNPDGSAFDGDLNDGTNAVGIEFRLNEGATNVRITISDDGGVVRTIDAGPHPQGLSVVYWHGEGDGGSAVAPGDYTFSVTATDDVGHSGYDVIINTGDVDIFTRGGTTIRNPAAANFGHLIGGNGGGFGGQVDLPRGPLNFKSDGSGFATAEPGLSLFAPWDARDASGNPNAGRLYMITSDDDGWLYYSDRLAVDAAGNPTTSTLYRFSSNLDPATLTAVASSHVVGEKGLGIDVVGTGGDKTIYWGLANTVVRMPIGEAETFDINEADTVALLPADFFVRDIVLDDDGFLYLSLRSGSEPGGTNPGVAVEAFDISGTLPVTREDALWSIPVGADNGNGRPVGFGIDRGDNLTSNVDDKIYFSGGSTAADGLWNTIRQIDDLATGGSTVVFVDISGSGTTSDNADMAVDAAGNLVWFENSSEFLMVVSPPDGPNEFTTPANDPISIDAATTANAFPVITSVTDVPNDQGNQLLVSWSGSFLDREGTAAIEGYNVYRKVEGAAKSSGPPGDWEFVGDTPATQSANYHLTVPSLVNETPDGSPATTYYVSAIGVEGGNWDSGSASGVSVDNLVPAAPSNVTATEGLSEGGLSIVTLSWDESPDADFKYFAVLRGSSSGFDPETALAIGTTTDITFIDDDVSVGNELFYRVVAFDFNGNRGEFSAEVSFMVTSVNGDGDGALPTVFSLEQNYPNPFNPETNIVYALPNAVDVKLQIFNMRGQVVKTLVDESQPAGNYTLRWDGTSDFGTRVASGVYVYIIRAGDFVQSKRMTMLK